MELRGWGVLVELVLNICLNLYISATIREKRVENDVLVGQGKVREFRNWSGKLGKDLKSQGI